MTIDWKRLGQLAGGTPVSSDVTQQTCDLAEIIVQQVEGTPNPKLELAMQVALWREAFEELEKEFNLSTDANQRKVMGFSDVQQLQLANQQLLIENNKLRYTMQFAANKLAQTAQTAQESGK